MTEQLWSNERIIHRPAEIRRQWAQEGKPRYEEDFLDATYAMVYEMRDEYEARLRIAEMAAKMDAVVEWEKVQERIAELETERKKAQMEQGEL